MRSKASITGHPVHPMLIPLPIACFIGALVSDIVARAGGYTDWYFMGYVLTIGGWALGLVAAVPGLIDYFNVVPKNSEASRRGLIHMGLNVTIVGLYFVSWLVKNANASDPTFSAAPLVLELIGCGLLVVSGWMGWTLVYKHHIGVDETAYREETRTIRRAG